MANSHCSEKINKQFFLPHNMVRVRLINAIVSDSRHPSSQPSPSTMTAICHRSHPVDDDRSSVDSNHHRHIPSAVTGGGGGGGCNHCRRQRQYCRHLPLLPSPSTTTAIRHSTMMYQCSSPHRLRIERSHYFCHQRPSTSKHSCRCPKYCPVLQSTSVGVTSTICTNDGVTTASHQSLIIHLQDVQRQADI